MAEWQTHKTQNLARATSCGFKSHFRHQLQAQKPVFLCNKSDNPKLMGLERAGYRKVASGKFSLPRRDSVAEQVPLSAPITGSKACFFLCYPKAKLKLDYIFSIDKISANHNC